MLTVTFIPPTRDGLRRCPEAGRSSQQAPAHLGVLESRVSGDFAGDEDLLGQVDLDGVLGELNLEDSEAAWDMKAVELEVEAHVGKTVAGLNDRGPGRAGEVRRGGHTRNAGAG